MPIKFNTATAYKAYKALKKAQGSLDTARRYKDRWPDDVKPAEARVEAAQAAYSASVAKLGDYIAEAEGRATARTIGPDDVMRCITEIENTLCISQKNMAGIKALVIDGAQRFPRAYKYMPEATAFWMEHNGKSWIVTEIFRTGCNQATRVQLTLTDVAKAAIIDNVSAF